MAGKNRVAATPSRARWSNAQWRRKQVAPFHCVALQATNWRRHHSERVPDEKVTLINENPIAFVRELKSKTGKDIWLCGGGDLASTLFPQIDEIVLKANPFVMGSGISLISGALRKAALEMKDKKIYDNGFMLLHDVVRK